MTHDGLHFAGKEGAALRIVDAQRTANSRSEEIIGQAQQAAAQIKQKIERQKSKYGWEFLFLGANIDAVETAGRFGIDADRAVDYVPDEQGTKLNYRVMSDTVSEFRACGRVHAACLNEIRQDMKKRGRRG